MKKLAVITISDSRHANGKLEDLSGDRIIKILSEKNFSLHERILVSDERSEISDSLKKCVPYYYFLNYKLPEEILNFI